jgi:hypothetical protein
MKNYIGKYRSGAASQPGGRYKKSYMENNILDSDVFNEFA